MGADGRHRILIIDDEPLVGKMFQRMLHRHEVSVVHSGREAIAVCREEPFDVILCDVMMPDMGGIDVYQQLRTVRPGQELRIVFMTGGVFEPRVHAFLDSIANPTLQKPIMRKDLARLIEDITSTRPD